MPEVYHEKGSNFESDRTLNAGVALVIIEMNSFDFAIKTKLLIILLLSFTYNEGNRKVDIFLPQIFL